MYPARRTAPPSLASSPASSAGSCAPHREVQTRRQEDEERLGTVARRRRAHDLAEETGWSSQAQPWRAPADEDGFACVPACARVLYWCGVCVFF